MSEKRRERVLVIAFWAGLPFFLGGFALLVWQVLYWLRTGVWQSYAVGRVWNPAPDWIGFTQLLEWMPLSVSLLALGILVMWLVAYVLLAWVDFPGG